MSEALKSNTTLRKLDLSGKQNNSRYTLAQRQAVFLFSVSLADNKSGCFGGMALGEALQKNKGLTELNLRGECDENYDFRIIMQAFDGLCATRRKQDWTERSKSHQ